MTGLVEKDLKLKESVLDDHAGLRLDQVAHQLWPDYSRGRLQGWIRQGHLTLNGQQASPKTKVNGGAIIELNVVVEPVGQWVPQELPLNVAFEDEHILIVDKPSGLVVHPAPGHSDKTLVNALLHHYPQLSGLPRAGIIHRIDKETTGLLVVAKSLPAHTKLVNMMQEREIKRSYLALVWGCVTGSATIDKPIGRHPKHRTRMAVVTSGKPAVTHYSVKTRFQQHTLLSVRLETGRTHQIRVHLAHAGYPIVGDPVYGGRQRSLPGVSDAVRQQFGAFKRQALYATELELQHPIFDDHISVQASLPEDFQQIMALLPKGSAC